MGGRAKAPVRDGGAFAPAGGGTSWWAKAPALARPWGGGVAAIRAAQYLNKLKGVRITYIRSELHNQTQIQ